MPTYANAPVISPPARIAFCPVRARDQIELRVNDARGRLVQRAVGQGILESTQIVWNLAANSCVKVSLGLYCGRVVTGSHWNHGKGVGLAMKREVIYSLSQVDTLSSKGKEGRSCPCE